MFCCPNCFEHPWLKRFITEHSSGTGSCDYCENDHVSVLDCAELSEPFDNLLSMYIPAETFEQGEFLINHLQWTWSVFADELGEHKQQALLEEIVNSDWDDDNGEPPIDASELYMRKSDRPLHSTHEDVWVDFCDQVRHDPQTTIPFDEFIAEELAESEELLQLGATFSRARPGFDLDEHKERIPWRAGKIGAPPPEKAAAGRANVKGQVVLYVADEEKTAVYEVRPTLGSYSSIGVLELERECRVLDLTKELPALNRFVSEGIHWFVEMRSLLNRLGEEMSIPLEHADDQRTYIQCQKLADYIRDNHYDGIRYPSALNPGGSSIVFFDPNVAHVVSSKLVRITDVTLNYEEDKEPRLADRLRAWEPQ